MKVTEFSTSSLFEYYEAITTAAAYAEDTGRQQLWEHLYELGMEIENELRDRNHPKFK